MQANLSHTLSALNDNLREEVLTGMVRLIQESYVFPDVAEQVQAIILEKLSRGEYSGITAPTEFNKIITRDLQEISKDKHLGLKFFDKPRVQSEAAKVQESKNRKRLLGLHNYGFEKVERLPGNIGYHKTLKFFEPEIAGDIAIASLNFLANTSAIIFDLRHNTGGSAGMISLICSYLFEGRVHLNNFHWRKDNRIEQVWTNSHFQGTSLKDKAVFILTSKRTFSGGEDFAYTLKNLNRATLVGERTAGGAHPGGLQTINDHFSVNIPVGRAVSPITGDNWEGTGVTPHIEVPEEQALHVSHYLLLKRLLEKSEDKDIMGDRWAKLLDELQEQICAWGLEPEKLKKHTVI